MKTTYKYFAKLDWGPVIWLDYNGPLVDLALSEARRRCKKPDGLQWVSRSTTESVFAQENTTT